MRKIQAMAELSVSRACGFAGLAMFTFMIGLSGDPYAALKLGGIIALLTCAVLLLKARNALSRPYKHTELWIMLKPDERPHADIAQQVVGNILQEVYVRFAQHTALLAALMFACAIGVKLAGIQPVAW
jgi:hypothetical protein